MLGLSSTSLTPGPLPTVPCQSRLPYQYSIHRSTHHLSTIMRQETLMRQPTTHPSLRKPANSCSIATTTGPLPLLLQNGYLHYARSHTSSILPRHRWRKVRRSHGRHWKMEASISHTKFSFSAAETHAIYLHVAANPTVRISHQNALPAHVSAALTHARGLGEREEHVMDVSVDIRRRLNPPLPFSFIGSTHHQCYLSYNRIRILQSFGYRTGRWPKGNIYPQHDHELRCR